MPTKVTYSRDVGNEKFERSAFLLDEGDVEDLARGLVHHLNATKQAHHILLSIKPCANVDGRISEFQGQKGPVLFFGFEAP